MVLLGGAAPRTAKDASLKRVWESMMTTDEVVEELFRNRPVGVGCVLDLLDEVVQIYT